MGSRRESGQGRPFAGLPSFHCKERINAAHHALADGRHGRRSSRSRCRHGGPGGAKGDCVIKAAEGTGSDEKAAKFQVDEALLQAVDWGAWAAWMANGSTPGWDFGKRSYKCSAGGIGIVCRGQAKLCKV